MKIWVDADACPGVIKDILFRAAERTKVYMTLVANHSMRIPPSSYVNFLHVTQGFDVADNEIVHRLSAGDLVITGDIPHALNPRGELYTTDNIKARLSMRDLMETLRDNGVNTGGPAPLGQADRQAFANQLDSFLTKYAK
jgi:uncharacterized protein YaiI (UPF0178 family)